MNNSGYNEKRTVDVESSFQPPTAGSALRLIRPTNMIDACYELLFSIGRCKLLLKEHAEKLSLRSDVSEVLQSSNIENVGDAFRLTEHVDAELISGNALSWCLELTVLPKAVKVNADVSLVESEGAGIIYKIADVEYELLSKVVFLPE